MLTKHWLKCDLHPLKQINCELSNLCVGSCGFVGQMEASNSVLPHLINYIQRS
jgi:hypothetical protein